MPLGAPNQSITIQLKQQGNQWVAHCTGNPQPYVGASLADVFEEIEHDLVGSDESEGAGAHANAGGDQTGSEIAHGEPQAEPSGLPTLKQMWDQQAEANMRRRQVVARMS
jgi:hypothetical protein